MKKKSLSKGQEALHALTKQYRPSIWSKFTKALKSYDLLSPGDKVACCISGGKDSMLMALLFKELSKHSDFPFEVTYLVMDPGYKQKDLDLLKNNLDLLEIPAIIAKTDIFQIVSSYPSPCYLCAKMRRGSLYRLAKRLGCNKIALGHHYDDVITTTLMNMLNSGSFQTMLPKLPSTHYEGMELIRPLYLVKEKDIIFFASSFSLTFLSCACSLTEREKKGEGELGKRKATRLLIEKLKETYNPLVEQNIFAAGENAIMDKLAGYSYKGEKHSFLDDYDLLKEETFAHIRQSHIEEMAEEKASAEHSDFMLDYSLKEKWGEIS